jgi:hypothetical protein
LSINNQFHISQIAKRIRALICNRLQTLTEHRRAEQQVRSSQAQAGTIKRRQEEDGSKEPSRAAASDQGSAATDEASTQPRVLVLQRDLLPNLPLVASIARAGLNVVGPFNRVSQALDWIETNRPDAAVLDIALWDGASFDLADELHRGKVPFLFYTSWDDLAAIPLELREMPFLEKPIHFVLVAKLLSKMLTDGQVREIQRKGDLDFAED